MVGTSCCTSAPELLADVAGRRLLERLDRLALGLRELRGDNHAQARQQVALAAAVELRGAPAAHAQELPVLRAGGDLQGDAPVGRRHLDLRAEHRLRVRHGHLDDEVGAAALEERRSGDARRHDEVARGPAREAGLALALVPDLRAVLDPGRDLDRVPLRPALTAGALAGAARFLDHGAVAAAAGARAREREEALVLGGDAAAAAHRADRGRRPRLGAPPAAGRARPFELHGDLRGEPLEGVLEGQVDGDADVGAALRVRPSPRRPPAAHAPEDPAEEIVQIAEVPAPLEASAARRAREHARAELIVLLALLGIREDVVGPLDLLEALLGGRVSRVAVRVELPGQLAVGLLDLVRG